MFYHYDLDHIKRLLRDIDVCGLSAPAGFFRAGIKVKQACYNGIGPDRWSPRFRKLVTWLLENFEADALIHDWEFAFQPRTYLHFSIANARMAVNAFYCAFRQDKGWRHLIKQTALGALLALLCQLFGWRGYRDTDITQFQLLEV
jgi:hypothetical protein